MRLDLSYPLPEYDLNGNEITPDNPPKCEYCHDQGYVITGAPSYEVKQCPFCDALEQRRKKRNTKTTSL